MSTTNTLPNPLPSADDAYAAFKQAEGTYTQSVSADAGSDTALAQAQLQKQTTAAAVQTNGIALRSAADVLIAAVQQAETSLPAAPPPDPTPATS